MPRGFAKCLGLVLLSFPVVAFAAFFFQADAEFTVLDEEISYRDDTTDTSSFETVLADSEGWVSQREKPFRGTGKSIRIWARFDVPPSNEARRVMLRTGAWESAEYFVVRDGRPVDRQKVGTLVPWGERTTQVTMTPALFHAGLVAVDLPPQAHMTVVARLATENRFLTITRLRFALWDANQVVEGELRDRFFQGAFLGVMLVLLLYNLTQLCLDIRELSYLYYVILLVMSTIMWGMFYGLSLEFLWPDRPAWDFYGMWIALPLLYWSIAQFVRHYLDTGRHFP